MFATGDIQKMFGVSPQTVRNWTKEFKEFLSLGATPAEAGSARKFNSDDLKVFSLIVEMTAYGATYEEVKVALKDGKRGALPEIPEDEDHITALLSPQEIARTMAIVRERDEAFAKIKLLEQERSNDRELIEEKEKEINRLNREIGKLEALLEVERQKKSNA